MRNNPPGIISVTLCFVLLNASLISCKNNKKTSNKNGALETSSVENNLKKDLFFKISLAEWSFHTPIHSGKMSAMNFAQRASELGFSGIEYVSTFYTSYYEDAKNPKAAFQNMLDTLKAKSEKYNVDNVLIMVDAEGPLASSNDSLRNEAVENHKKWVDAAAFLDAHAIRVNLRGSKDPEEWTKYAVEGITKLAKYAKTKNVEVLVENHGGFSSNAEMLTAVLDSVSLSNVGTLPDFGNFCLIGHVGNCKKIYPRYKGVKLMMPYAKGVSAKSYHFNEEGEETKIDYSRMLKIVKNAHFTGYIGVEYEGTELTPKEGILATKALLIKTAKKL